MKTRLTVLAMMGMASASFAATPLKQVNVTLKGPHGEVAMVHAEVADTEASRQYGLMNRDSMPADAGMIFTWPKPQKVGFWMKDTHIPLDMLFISRGYVVAVAPQAKPMDETVISPPGVVDAVLEVNGGWASAHKLGPGWKISINK
jgi:uncharacterized membrane protein (UPF0127 family)